MSYKVIWSNFAESELDKIFEYYIEQASLKVAKKIIKNILA
ncbi:Putative plasmid stabilization system protein (fragment) [Flavobacterium psychrophilum]